MDRILTIQNGLKNTTHSGNYLIDETTQLRSEEAILQRLKEEVSRSDRYKSEFSTLLIRVSSRKQNNALHQYLVDKYLMRKIADIVRQEMRDSDVAGCVNRHSILVLLTETDKKGAGIFALRVLNRIREFDKQVNKGILPFHTSMLRYSNKNGTRFLSSQMIKDFAS